MIRVPGPSPRKSECLSAGRCNTTGPYCLQFLRDTVMHDSAHQHHGFPIAIRHRQGYGPVHVNFIPWESGRDAGRRLHGPNFSGKRGADCQQVAPWPAGTENHEPGSLSGS